MTKKKDIYHEYIILASRALLKCNACGNEQEDESSGHKHIDDPVRILCPVCNKIVGHKVKGIIKTVKELGETEFSETKEVIKISPPLEIGELKKEKIKPE